MVDKSADSNRRNDDDESVRGNHDELPGSSKLNDLATCYKHEKNSQRPFTKNTHYAEAEGFGRIGGLGGSRFEEGRYAMRYPETSASTMTKIDKKKSDAETRCYGDFDHEKRDGELMV